MLFVVRCLLLVGCCMLRPVCCWLVVELAFVDVCVVCWLLLVYCCLLIVGGCWRLSRVCDFVWFVVVVVVVCS